ncbi:hypothetical protein B0H19DRAFT_1250797 [Mycena capillaripes]|nr:hypothetical protein B0H19DRAFT_1250797 [Mycena capillaripes]
MNVHGLLCVIRSDEFVEEAASWCSEDGMKLTYGDDTIEIAKFKPMYLTLAERYERIVAEEIFMGYPPPSALTTDLDNPRNPCAAWEEIFIFWLLSIPALREKFTWEYNGELIWRPGPCMELIGAFDRANDVLVVAMVLYQNVCCVGILDKTSRKTMQSRYVPSAPSLIVSQLLVFNLGVFRPVQVYFAGRFLNESHMTLS